MIREMRACVNDLDSVAALPVYGSGSTSCVTPQEVCYTNKHTTKFTLRKKLKHKLT
jgi:hypothetical protein